MATAYVSFGGAGEVMAGGVLPVRRGNPSSTETVTTSGTSAATTNAAAYSGVATIDCASALYAVVGPNPTAAPTTGWYIPAGITTDIAVNTGDKVALIDV